MARRSGLSLRSPVSADGCSAWLPLPWATPENERRKPKRNLTFIRERVHSEALHYAVLRDQGRLSVQRHARDGPWGTSVRQPFATRTADVAPAAVGKRAAHRGGHDGAAADRAADPPPDGSVGRKARLE